MATKRVVVIEGEEAAAEAMQATLPLLEKLALDIEWLRPEVGASAHERHGTGFPDEARRAVDASDATFFGATSGPSVGAIFYLRWGKKTYANVRPARWMPGYRSPLARPEGVDFVIVRENLEDLYVGIEGEVEELEPLGLRSLVFQRPVAELGPGRFAIKLITEAGSERVTRHAFELARHRRAAGGRGKLTCSAKYNMLPRSDGLFMKVAERVAPSYPEIEFEQLIVDDLAHRLALRPHDFDVIVLPNLYGDVLSDLAGGLIGGLGLAPSGCYGDDYAYFESAHGTAPDIAGRNIVNPTATILSAVMLLDYLGIAEAARTLEGAVERVYAEGAVLTPDQGGTASTTAFCDAVARHL